MSTEESKAVVRRVIESFGTGNLDPIDEMIAPDYVGYDPALPEPTRGPEGLKQEVLGYRAAFPDLTVTVEQQTAEGEWVTTRWTASGTHQGDLMGLAPTGKQATITGISLDRVVGGKIVEERTVWDLFGLMQQLGAVPAPATA